MTYAEIIAGVLDRAPKTRQQIADETGIEAAQVSAALSVMRARGLAARSSEGWTLPDVETKPNGHVLDRTWLPCGPATIADAGAGDAEAIAEPPPDEPPSAIADARVLSATDAIAGNFAATVLAEAQAIVYGDREMTHGEPAKNLAAIARIWTALLAQRLAPGAGVTPDVVCLMMAGLKLARAANKPSHRDHARDVCGYMALMERCGYLDTTG